MSQFPLLDPQLLTQLPPVAIKAMRVVEGALTGLHQSPHQGQSIEFNQHKEYAPGDELRHMDWKLYAKSDRYYIKQFEDETNLRAYLLVDASASMLYPEAPEDERDNKFTYASVLALSMAYLLFRQRDAVGLMTFNHRLQTLMPPRNRPSYLIPMAQSLSQQRPSGQTDFKVILQRLAEIARRRSQIYIFSDFFEDVDDLQGPLQQLAHQGHDLVLFHLLDPDELGFPFRDRTLFEDLEVVDQHLQVDAHSIRPYYMEELRLYLDQMTRLSREAGIDYRRVDTSTPALNTLRDFLLHRHHARRSRR